MADIIYSIAQASARLDAIARKVKTTGERVALADDQGEVLAWLVSPADALELQEMRALAAYCARRARGQNDSIPHDEANLPLFGDDAT